MSEGRKISHAVVQASGEVLRKSIAHVRDKHPFAIQASSEVVRRAIAHVRDKHPYWARKDGADHFMVFSYDHGRCDMAPRLQYEEFGRMFAIQSYGDIMST